MSTLRLGMAALAIACTASLASAQTTNPPADATTESRETHASGGCRMKPRHLLLRRKPRNPLPRRR